MNEPSLPTLPIVHMNGSSAKSLLEDNRKAYSALNNARDILCEISPHPRDYYVSQDPDAYQKARKEHDARIHAVTAIMTELDIIGEHLMKSIKY